MNLQKKKKLVARTLLVGTDKVVIDSERMDEIKEAITRQDVRDLVKSGAIRIKDPKGRRTNVKRKRRRIGKVKIKVNTRKKDYVIMTRKLRAYIKELKIQGKIDNNLYRELRKKIRNKAFKSKRQLRETIQ